MGKLTSVTFGVAQALEREERGGVHVCACVVVVGGVVSPGAQRLVRGALLEKSPSEAPTIDQKLMSGAGIKPAWPLLTFMCWRRRGGNICDRHLLQALSPRTRQGLEPEAIRGNTGPTG